MATTTTQPQTFSIEDAKVALKDILDAFKEPNNMDTMKEAWEGAGNDMLKMMQVVFPLATQIQMTIIQKYGFPADGEGIIRFVQTIKHYERQDPEVAQLNSQVRNLVMPHMAAPPPDTSTAVAAT